MISTPWKLHMPSFLPGRRSQWPRGIIPVGPREMMRTFDVLSIARQFPALANLVEDITDLDIPDDSIARNSAIAVLPGTMPHFVVQYRAPVTSSYVFGDTKVPHRAYQHLATTPRTGIVTISPHGPLGVIVARLKPEAAACLLGDHIYEFADTKIDLDAVFGAGVVTSLAETLAIARSSHDRIAAVSRFLLTNMRARESDPLVCCAAASLRSNPFLRLRSLAEELGLSERHLSRRFKAMFGTGPKRFARSARLEHVLAACDSETSWASIACSCGFADQAHMINDFKSILGVTPTSFFRSPLIGEYATARQRNDHRGSCSAISK
jgi:AraC-like DNA-binding protein